MTSQEARIFLKVEEFESYEEAFEFQLFELKQQLISKPCIPQLLQVRILKLKQLKEICKVLQIDVQKTSLELKINHLNSFNLIDCFNTYQKNKTLILIQLSSNLNINSLEISMNLLLQNLKQWSMLWHKKVIHKKDKILLSKELESMEFYQVLKELKEHNIIYFNDLKEEKLPANLIYEIKRLNLISESFSQD